LSVDNVLGLALRLLRGGDRGGGGELSATSPTGDVERGWEFLRKLLTRHVRFTVQLGKIPCESNVARPTWVHLLTAA
jgi:hypothetical protein